MENISALHAVKEELTYLNQMFPLSEFVDHFDTFADGSFPSHWHNEFELQIMLKGNAEYRVNGTRYMVSEGSAIYIAPEAVHMMKALSSNAIGYNVVLLPQFLTNLFQVSNCEKYAAPLTSRHPEAFVITPERKEGHAVLELLKRMYYAESTHTAYELFLLEHLIGIWRNLLAILPKAASVSEDSSKFLREQRMRTMLHFIRKNYAQPITISEIAASANISKSECFRCFSELSRMTPIEYVNLFRLLQAAQLLTSTKNSISDICYSTGFNNTSYFTKKFKEQYKATPRSYRTQNLP